MVLRGEEAQYVEFNCLQFDPVIFTTINMVEGSGDAGPLVTRIIAVSSLGFRMQLQTEEKRSIPADVEVRVSWVSFTKQTDSSRRYVDYQGGVTHEDSTVNF